MMKKELNVRILIALTCLLIVSCTSFKKEQFVLSSPDAKLRVKIFHQADSGNITFFASLNGQVVLESSSLGIRLAGDNLDFTGSLSFTGYEEKHIDESYFMPTGKRMERRNQCNEGVFGFENDKGSQLSLIFRVFDDGLAFRYHVDNKEWSSVELEESGYQFGSISQLWTIPFSSGDERTYKKYETTTELSEQALSFPVLIETKDGHWFLAAESDVSAYPLSSGLLEGESLSYVFAREKEALNKVSPGFSSPWRVLILGDKLSNIVESCIVDHLAPPAGDVDYSWMKAGVTSFPWWGENEANSHPEILKKYIDLSAEMDWPYIEFDVALIGAPARAVETWKTTPWIKDIVEYGNARGVKCYGWDEYSNLDTPEKREDVFSRYAELGIAGCKVDFVNSYSQHTREVVEEIIKDAAKYKLLLSFHGAQSPRGFARTYPHVMTFEAAKGSEYYLTINGGKGVTPEHNCILPFTRNVLGSMDYTPVAFTSEVRTTTMAHELALSVVFESGWQGLCDIPEAYLESPARPFLTGLPAAWDESRLLAGYPGEYCCMARRSGKTWYVAGISASSEGEVSLDLSPILKELREVEVYADLPGDKDVLHVVKREVSGSKAFEIDLKENGGFAFMFSEK